MQWICCGCSLFALTVYLFPSVINFNEGLGWLGFLSVPLYTIVVLILSLISTKGQVKSKLLFTATIAVVIFTVISFLNMFLEFLPFGSQAIVFQDVISVAIFISWIVYSNLYFKKGCTDK